MAKQIQGWRDLSGHYRHIYLAPHMDDATLSCGGVIRQRVLAGEPVLVVTACAGSPDPAGPFNALAEEMHTEYGVTGGEAVALRLKEDEAAMHELGADYLWLDYLDSIYRVPDKYYSDPTIFGPVADGDPLAAELSALLVVLSQRCPDATIYVPLGIGHHVDHQAAFLAGVAAHNFDLPIVFYEDFPYVRTPGALESRFSEIGVNLEPEDIAIDDTFELKLDAIDRYTTQVERIFGSSEDMREGTRLFAAKRAPSGHHYGERLWRRV
jgi:LmbE family N-acetylglucosaminyl deacetylase